VNRYGRVPLADFAVLVETPRPAASAGAVSAVTASLAASLVVKACVLTRDGSLAVERERASALADLLGRFADHDEDAFAAYLAAADPEAKAAAASAAAAGAGAFAIACAELAGLADDVALRCSTHVVGESGVAGILARAAGAAAEAIAAANEPG
jgi:formiminotetrahydrofolate cyclodeaminase